MENNTTFINNREINKNIAIKANLERKEFLSKHERPAKKSNRNNWKELLWTMEEFESNC